VVKPSPPRSATGSAARTSPRTSCGRSVMPPTTARWTRTSAPALQRSSGGAARTHSLRLGRRAARFAGHAHAHVPPSQDESHRAAVGSRAARSPGSRRAVGRADDRTTRISSPHRAGSSSSSRSIAVAPRRMRRFSAISRSSCGTSAFGIPRCAGTTSTAHARRPVLQSRTSSPGRMRHALSTPSRSPTHRIGGAGRHDSARACMTPGDPALGRAWSVNEGRASRERAAIPRDEVLDVIRDVERVACRRRTSAPRMRDALVPQELRGDAGNRRIRPGVRTAMTLKRNCSPPGVVGRYAWCDRPRGHGSTRTRASAPPEISSAPVRPVLRGRT